MSWWTAALSGIMSGMGGAQGKGGPKSKQNMDQWTERGFMRPEDPVGGNPGFMTENFWTQQPKEQDMSTDYLTQDYWGEPEPSMSDRVEDVIKQRAAGAMAGRYGRPSGQQYRGSGMAMSGARNYNPSPLPMNVFGNPWAHGYREQKSFISPWMSGTGMYR